MLESSVFPSLLASKDLLSPLPQAPKDRCAASVRLSRPERWPRVAVCWGYRQSLDVWAGAHRGV